MRTRTFLLVGLFVAILVAGGASYYASAHPDGLNYVAEQAGFIDSEQASPTAEGPFAGYSTKGVDNERLSGGVAGVAGVLLVGVLGTGLFWAVRRRGDDPEQAGETGA